MCFLKTRNFGAKFSCISNCLDGAELTTKAFFLLVAESGWPDGKTRNSKIFTDVGSHIKVLGGEEQHSVFSSGLVKWTDKCSNSGRVLCVFIAWGVHRKAAKAMAGSRVLQWLPPITSDFFLRCVYLKASLISLKRDCVRRAIGEARQSRKCHFKEWHCTVNRVTFSCRFHRVEISRKMISLALVLWSCPRGGHTGRVQAISIQTCSLVCAYLDIDAYCQLKEFLFANVSCCWPWEFS